MARKISSRNDPLTPRGSWPESHSASRRQDSPSSPTLSFYNRDIQQPFLHKSNFKLIVLRFVFCRNNFNIDHFKSNPFYSIDIRIFKSSEFSNKSGNLQYIVCVQNLGNIVRVFWNYICLFLRSTVFKYLRATVFSCDGC